MRDRAAAKAALSVTDAEPALAKALHSGRGGPVSGARVSSAELPMQRAGKTQVDESRRRSSVKA